MADIKLTIWNEFIHEKNDQRVIDVYPDGIHEALAKHFRTCDGITVRTATQDQHEHGLTQKILDDTDVLTWWAHVGHAKIDDAIVDRIQQRILDGMGLIVMHSGHYSKIFRRMLGTNCSLRWREIAEKQRIWVVNPSHPIAAGIGPYIELPHTEMYGEHFDIPEPDELVFISWFQGGEVFRSGCTFTRGKGKIFYFCPGHETFPIYYNPEILRVLENAVRWAKFAGNTQSEANNINCEPLENIDNQ